MIQGLGIAKLRVSVIRGQSLVTSVPICIAQSSLVCIWRHSMIQAQGLKAHVICARASGYVALMFGPVLLLDLDVRYFRIVDDALVNLHRSEPA